MQPLRVVDELGDGPVHSTSEVLDKVSTMTDRLEELLERLEQDLDQREES